MLAELILWALLAVLIGWFCLVAWIGCRDATQALERRRGRR